MPNSQYRLKVGGTEVTHPNIELLVLIAAYTLAPTCWSETGRAVDTAEAHGRTETFRRVEARYRGMSERRPTAENIQGKHIKI